MMMHLDHLLNILKFDIQLKHEVAVERATS